MLDRFAALELLRWGMQGVIASTFSIDQQKRFLAPLRNILNMSGCNISFNEGGIVAFRKENIKKVAVYPAMWVEPYEKGTIFVSDAYIKYAKPYAVQKILDEIRNM